MEKRRLVNFRPLVLILLCLSAGIFTAGIFISNDTVKIISFAVCAASIIVFILIKKLNWIVYAAAFILGLLLLCGTAYNYDRQKLTLDNAEITGRVISEKIIEGDRCYFYADKLEADGLNIKGKIRIYTSYDSETEFDYNAGDYISFTADLLPEAFSVKSDFLYNFRMKSYYIDWCSDIEKVSEGQPPAIVRIRLNLKDKLYGNLKADTADITYALLTGDRSGISENLYNDIKASGVAHIFAVSGMHICILAAAVILLLKKLKAKRYVTLIVTPVILIAYGAFCGFPSSVIRALIMTVVYLAADYLGEKKDSLSTFSLAAIIILIIFPTDLFMLGFIMSFLAVFGLILYVQTKPLWFKKLPKTFGAVIQSSVAANILILPVIITAFGEIAILFLPANVILLPIITVIYVCMLILAAVVLILPFLAPLLILCEGLVLPIKLVVFTIGSLSINIISVGMSAALLSGYYAIVAVTSRFVFLKPKTKLEISSIIACASMVTAIFI